MKNAGYSQKAQGPYGAGYGSATADPYSGYASTAGYGSSAADYGASAYAGYGSAAGYGQR
jgi:L-aminopeptidase/D-esterase-like protein